jgi:restriction system protein
MTLWTVRCGGDGAYEQEAVAQKIVGIGWGGLGDISKIDSREELMLHFSTTLPNDSLASIRNQLAQVYAFRSRIQIGDLVALPLRNSASIAFGRITGDYKFVKDAHHYVSHQRSVEWIKEVPRSLIDQDLLYSFGAFSTVFEVKRNDAEARIVALLSGTKIQTVKPGDPKNIDASEYDNPEAFDFELFARDQIRKVIEQKFTGHGLAKLVGEILEAEGYTVLVSPEGPDGGVDVLAGSGKTGFEDPKIAVQVKSGNQTVDAPMLRDLQGTMSIFGATNGLVVSWGGFTSQALKDARKAFLQVHTWNSDDVINHITANYDALSPETQSVLRLKKIWTTLPADE